MKSVLRLGASGMTGALMVGLMTLVLLPWLGGPALFGGDTGALVRTLFEEQSRGAELTRQDQAVLRSLDGKHHVTGELIAGRLGLIEAAERFERLDDDRADGDERLSGRGPGTSRRAETYDLIFKWANVSLNGKPAEKAAVLGRLEAERARLEGAAPAAQ